MSLLKALPARLIVVAVLSTVAAAPYLHAQQEAGQSSSQSSVAVLDAPVSPIALPDAPGALPSPATIDEAVTFLPTSLAGKYHRTVKADQQAQPLTAGDKLKLSVMTQLSLTNLGGNLFSAGLSHVRDGRPHYGVDSGAFGQRLGALSLKGASQNFFSYGLYAAAFHDDPRYYVMGPSQKIQKRAIYSGTRVFITRKDNGNSAINWPKLAGITTGAALSNSYYPSRDRGVTNTVYSIFGSIGTAALTNELNEFIGDAMRLIRHKK